MKKSAILYIACLGLLLSCNKPQILAPTDFDVNISKTTLSLADTAKFTFSGNVQNIVFYSGEAGNDYYAENNFSATGGIPQMTFTTSITGSPLAAGNANLTILVSSDFNGNYVQSDIQKATWTDITSQVTLNAAAQTVKLGSYTTVGNPLYIAFRFQSVSPATQAQRVVTVSAFTFQTVYPSMTYTNASNVYFAGFTPFDFAGSAGSWSIPVTSTSNNTFTHAAVVSGSPADDDWAISAPMSFNSISGSVGTPIKDITKTMPVNYTYKFKKAGTYTMVFVGQNASNDKSKEVVKQFQVTVTP